MDTAEYQRYHIETGNAPNIAPYPSRFKVKINKFNLARLLIGEFFTYRGNKKVILSSPCVYGVFSGTWGGFSPREELCVGCLRCTTEHPEIAQIFKNPERSHFGDSYFTPEQYDTVVYEARTGMVPVKGAGYRGKFGGEGWDGMWTDMSEIVRPTRDGIHGREFISTSVDIGGNPPFLSFDSEGNPESLQPGLSIPIPFLFDVPPEQAREALLLNILSRAAGELRTFAVIPVKEIVEHSLQLSSIVPLVDSGGMSALERLAFNPLMIEIDSWDKKLYQKIRKHHPKSLVSLRVHDGEDVSELYREGVRIFHLAADYHGRGHKGKFILESIRNMHQALVRERCRDQVTLIGSGGIVAAEHLPKAIICGCDAVALETPILAGLQAKFLGDCSESKNSRFEIPSNLSVDWGVQRIKNIANSWRDQLLEILGAMGLREVRRLRGELGRAMFQNECENDAFAGIDGYELQ